MRTKTITLTLAAMCVSLSAMAIPAKRGNRVVTQPDGTTITIHKVGDERMHFTLTDDDKLLVKDDNGQYSYADVNTDGSLASTGVKAVDSAVRPVEHKSLVKSIADINSAEVLSARIKTKRRSIAQTGLGTYTSNFPKKGEIKGLIILVQYSDTKFMTSYSSSAKQYFTDMINKAGFSEYNATGSATDYFEYSSMGQFQPKFTVVGPVTLSNKMSYYGGNDSNGDDLRPAEMIQEACQLVDSQVNFADFDNDGDGECDNVYVFYAGEGEASSDDTNTIWPHSWSFDDAGLSLKLDGVSINRYACSNECYNNEPDGIGTFVHEFSHVMGLPDLYHTTDNTAYYTPCDYDIMDYGSYNNDSRTPPVYSAYERNAMGWIDLKVLDGAEIVSLENLGTSNSACIVQTSKTNEFYLFENRQQTGWDAYIPNHGMLIWHIDFNQTVFDNNVVNNTKSHQYVDIVEANNNTNGQTTSTRKGWVWPGTSNKTSFTSSTTPAFKTWSGTAIDLPITDITESNGVITFKVDGGVKIDTPVPHESSRIETGSDYFVAAWDAVDGATDYKVWVYAIADDNTAKSIQRASANETETADMGSSTTITLPDGWTSSSTDAYATSGNYGNAAPSAKLGSNNAYIQTRVFSHNVTAISFWIKGMSTKNSSSVLNVTGLVNGSWVDIQSVTPTSEKSSTVSITDIPAGVTQVKFTYSKSKGNVAIDDIVITTSGVADELLAEYNGVTTNGATSLRVDKLKEGCTKYKFAVAATPDGSNYSKTSEYIQVELESTGINSITVNSEIVAERYTDLSGRAVTNPEQGLYIKTVTYSDGSVKTSKVLVK